MLLRTRLLLFATLLTWSSDARAGLVVQIGADANNPTEVFDNGVTVYVPVMISGSGNLSDFSFKFQITDSQPLNAVTPVTPLEFVPTGNGPSGDPTTDRTVKDANYVFSSVGSLAVDSLTNPPALTIGNASTAGGPSDPYTYYSGADFGDSAVPLTSGGAVLLDLAVHFGPASTTNLAADYFQISLVNSGTAFDFSDGKSLGLAGITVTGGVVKVDNPSQGSVSPIPEPSTLLSAAGGLSLAAAWRLRRRGRAE